ncbi:uncharacterized protein K460DRAFT_432368 [Cucurbitaria berberidis CBS 394.84]|uniref:Uncharacterized protein n=1 Tax=Cucurbitaria berberidis CBS 394.84 TaxID=1168544 RepID=A0A9P4GCZ7_9PLEO|nr:uncharacterized protein K460DRAFT_432368 [Cucurbitaria berberidis CBS 394.84]KAF1842935.1 hypothetical protein K460DRAFT_432368 [Cucurbitaria berberidis CBS 394.84]
MIGRSVDSAIPTIMFFCEEKEPRKKAKNAIEEGGFLERLPGFRLGHQAKQPDVGSLIQPATENDGAQSLSLNNSVLDVYFDSTRPILADGMPIFVKHTNGLLRQATANAVFKGHRYVYMSVSHVFVDSIPYARRSTADSDSEYDFGSGTELEDYDDCIDATSRGSISSPEESSEDQLDLAASGSGSSALMNETALTQRVLHDRVSSPTGIIRVNPRLKTEHSDKALVVVTPPIESLEPTSIITHTSHGTISGLLSNNATHMRLPGSNTFQKVYQIALDAPLIWGDCGSVVIDLATSEPYGYIVASSMTKRIAYIMVASEAFEILEVSWKMPHLVTTEASSGDIERKVSLHRSDTVSSIGSDAYSPLPPGRWTLDFHGNCPRCHHHHTGVKIKVDVSHDSSKVSHVRCEMCQENWLAFGGRNSTRISLLSTLTADPDPVEKEVRSTLSKLVRSTTAITAPWLLNIPETSPEHSVRSTTSNGLQPSFGPMATTAQTSSSVPLSRVQRLKPSTSLSSLPTTPTIDIGDKGHPKQPLSNLKQRVQARFPILQGAKVKQLFRHSKKPQMSAEKRENYPVHISAGNELGPSTSFQEELYTSGQESGSEVLHNDPSVSDSANMNSEVADFIADLRNDPISEMNKKERVIWLREKLTKFKSSRKIFDQPAHSIVVNSGTRVTSVEPPLASFVQDSRRHSSEMLYLGSHLSYFDRWSSEAALHGRPLSMSERGTELSDASTVADDNIVASDPRNALVESLQRARRASESPRPLSLNNLSLSWGNIRQARAEAHYSLDSPRYSIDSAPTECGVKTRTSNYPSRRSGARARRPRTITPSSA